MTVDLKMVVEAVVSKQQARFDVVVSCVGNVKATFSKYLTTIKLNCIGVVPLLRHSPQC